MSRFKQNSVRLLASVIASLVIVWILSPVIPLNIFRYSSQAERLIAQLEDRPANDQSQAIKELKAMGTEAIPFLIEHLNDTRGSHSYSSRTVGKSCRAILHSMIDLAGASYRYRDTPTGSVSAEQVTFDTFVKSDFVTYRYWWRQSRHQTLAGLRADYLRWRIEKETSFGFVDQSQETAVTGELRELLAEINGTPVD